MAQRLRPAGEDHFVAAVADIAKRGVDALHPRTAVDLNRERDLLVPHTKPQRGDPCRVHLVLNDVDAAKDHEVEGRRRKRLAHQQRSTRLNGKIDRGERARLPARLQEGRAGTIDEVDRAAHSAASFHAPVRRMSGKRPSSSSGV